MARKTLEDMRGGVDLTARQSLSHPIKYNGRTVYVQGNYEDGLLSGIAGASIKQDIEMMILKSDMPAMPLPIHRIQTPRVPNALFKPVNVQSDETGAHWLFNLVKVAA